MFGSHIARQELMTFLHLLQVVMKDPVIAADGHTYEKLAIKQWLQHHNTSPVAGPQLNHQRLIANVAVRAAIQVQQN